MGDGSDFAPFLFSARDLDQINYDRNIYKHSTSHPPSPIITKRSSTTIPTNNSSPHHLPPSIQPIDTIPTTSGGLLTPSLSLFLSCLSRARRSAWLVRSVRWGLLSAKSIACMHHLSRIIERGKFEKSVICDTPFCFTLRARFSFICHGLIFCCFFICISICGCCRVFKR
jgi:hypothetical protein